MKRKVEAKSLKNVLAKLCEVS